MGSSLSDAAPLADLKKKILDFSLRLKMVFIGDQMTSFVASQSEKGIPVLFFTRSPDLLTVRQDFVRIR